MCYLIKDKENIYRAYLKDNTYTYFHKIGPECKKCILMGLDKLSYETRKMRFNSPIKTFSKKELNYLTDIDQYNHFALGGGLCHKSQNPGMGIGRYIRLNHQPNTAEIALTVIDQYQNKGLGTLLLCLLIKYGAQNNIEKFCGYSSYNNKAIIHLFQKFGGHMVGSEGDLIHLEFDLLSNYNKAEMILNNSETKNSNSYLY